MWPGTDFGERASERNAKWDPAHVPATYFALAALLVLGDDLGRVKRRQTLTWLRRMQRPDGSFGETLVDGKLEGGRDPRFAHCACGIRYILRGTRAATLTIDDQSVEDVNVDALVRCIRAAEVRRAHFLAQLVQCEAYKQTVIRRWNRRRGVPRTACRLHILLNRCPTLHQSPKSLKPSIRHPDSSSLQPNRSGPMASRPTNRLLRTRPNPGFRIPRLKAKFRNQRTRIRHPLLSTGRP